MMRGGGVASGRGLMSGWLAGSGPFVGAGTGWPVAELAICL